MAYRGSAFVQQEIAPFDWNYRFNGCARSPSNEVTEQEYANPSGQHSNALYAAGHPQPSNNTPQSPLKKRAAWGSEVGDLQPCWNIWGSPPRLPDPTTSKASSHVASLGPASVEMSTNRRDARAPSPPLNASIHAAALSTPSSSLLSPSCFWFESGNCKVAHLGGSSAQSGTVTASDPRPVMVSPPLSPQTSWDQGESLSPNGPTSINQVQTANAHEALKEPGLEGYLDDPDQHGSLYDPVPAIHDLEGVIAPISTALYLVKFKNGRTDVYTVSEKTVFPITVGSLVLVDADRGRDIGKVFAANIPIEQAAYIKWKQFYERQQVLSQCATKDAGAALSACSPKQILRAAQPNEVRQLSAKRAEEQRAVRQCNQKVRDRELDMVIVDAEYQWDHRKLTFFYKAHKRVDFRDLVRELFRMYKTRIWMCAVHTN